MADEKISPAIHDNDPAGVERRGNQTHVDLNKNLEAK
jgi:hypothetical protein